MDVTLILQRVALGGYAMATLLAFASLLLRRRHVISLAPLFAAAGFLCQLLVFIGVGGNSAKLPVASLDGVLAFLTLFAVLVYLYGYWRFELHVLGIILLPFALILQLVSGSLPQETLPVAEGLRHPLLWLHISVSSLSVGAFFLTFTFAVIYLIQERAVKGKRSTRFFLALPSLSTCDRVLHVSLLVGFVLLTIGLVAAAVWSTSFGDGWGNPREILAFIAWIIFGVVLYARLVRGWRGRKFAILAIFGFIAVMLRVLGGSVL